jgi:hypothetical protein
MMDDERERRLIEFLALEVRGLVYAVSCPTARRSCIFQSLITPTCWRFALRGLCIDASRAV